MGLKWVHGLTASDAGTKRSQARHRSRKQDSDVRIPNTWGDQRKKHEHMELREQTKKMPSGTSACVFWLGFKDLDKNTSQRKVYQRHFQVFLGQILQNLKAGRAKSG